MKSSIKMGGNMDAGVVMSANAKTRLALGGGLDFECRGADGKVKWREHIDFLAAPRKWIWWKVALVLLAGAAVGMLIGHWSWLVLFGVVCNGGRDDVLDKYLKGSAYTAAWFLGLAGTGTKAAADTLASHGGWSEVNPYAGNRKTITWGTTASQSNTASQVSFAITGSATVAGAFIASVNTGTAGILFMVADFGASRAVVNGDTLNVTPTTTA